MPSRAIRVASYTVARESDRAADRLALVQDDAF
jgi:hypothetical protein